MESPQAIHNRIEEAIVNGNIALVQKLITIHGVSLSPEWLNGYNFLRIATENNKTVICKFLLQSGCKVNHETPDGAFANTPLHIAVAQDRAKIVKRLLAKGANSSAIGLKGQTPLHIAALNKKDEGAMVGLLLRNGANPDIRDIRGKTALHLACSISDNTHVVFELLEHSSRNIDCKDNRGKPPLQIALRKGNGNIINMLLRNGANVNVMGDLLRKAIDCVTEEMYIQLFNYRIWRGIPADTEDEEEPKSLEAYGVASFMLDISIEVLQEHVFMMKYVGMQLCDQLQIDPVEDMAKYRKKYKKELNTLKIVPIGKTKMTYFDFLRKNVQRLVALPEKENIWKVLEGEEYEVFFPKFKRLISCHFHQWKNREESIKIVKSTGRKVFQGLSDEMVDLVLSFLRNDELYEFTRCIADIFQN